MTDEKLAKIKRLLDATSGPEHEQIKRVYKKWTDNTEIIEEKHYVKFESKGFMEHALYQIIQLMLTATEDFDDIEENGKEYICMWLTNFEEDQIKLYYKYYLPLLTDEIHSFISAFALKNDIIPSNDKLANYKTSEDVSENKIAQVRNIMNNLTKYSKPTL